TAKCGDGICSLGELGSFSKTKCDEDCADKAGCTGPEPYLYYNPSTHQVDNRHESMRVSWSSTRGSFDEDHTGRTESDFAETTSDNTWTAPDETGSVFLWVVLRDDRGGTDFRSFEVKVK